MRYAIPTISFLLLQLSCTARPDEHSQLMREIDTVVNMPKKALPIEMYAGYYSLRPDGKVAIIYDADVRDEGPKPADYGCSEILKNDTLVDVPCEPDNRLRAGERRWVRYSEMPGVIGGGCSIINVIYDRAIRRVEEVSCNGPF